MKANTAVMLIRFARTLPLEEVTRYFDLLSKFNSSSSESCIHNIFARESRPGAKD